MNGESKMVPSATRWLKPDAPATSRCPGFHSATNRICWHVLFKTHHIYSIVFIFQLSIHVYNPYLSIFPYSIALCLFGLSFWSMKATVNHVAQEEPRSGGLWGGKGPWGPRLQVGQLEVVHLFLGVGKRFKKMLTKFDPIKFSDFFKMWIDWSTWVLWLSQLCFKLFPVEAVGAATGWAVQLSLRDLLPMMWLLVLLAIQLG